MGVGKQCGKIPFMESPFAGQDGAKEDLWRVDLKHPWRYPRDLKEIMVKG